MDLDAYHHALNCGFTESEATQLGEEAFEDAMLLRAQEKAYYEALEKAEAERDRLREALEWYEKIVGECNRRGQEGEDARNAIAQDMGKRARTALQEADDA